MKMEESTATVNIILPSVLLSSGAGMKQENYYQLENITT